MKKKMRSLLLIMLLVLAIGCPVSAAEFGSIYLETERLATEEINTLGTQILPQLSQQCGVDIRVDVICDTGEFADLEELAEAFYAGYEYGADYGGSGLSLTVLVHEEGDNGTVLDDWCVYAGGESGELREDGTAYITYILDSVLTTQNWESDPNQGTAILEASIYSLVAAMESFAAESAGTGSDNTAAENNVPVSNENWMDSEPMLDHITDTADILTEEEWQQLEVQARNIAEQYDFGVYAIIVDDYLEYADGSVFEAAMELYQTYSLGLGDDKGGLLLLLSMYDRDYSLITYGEFGEYAFNDAGREALTEFFRDDFSGDNWYEGLSDYVNWSGEYLAAAKDGSPYSADNLPADSAAVRKMIRNRILIILLFPLLVAWIVVAVLNAKMKSVAAATQAANYMVGELELTGQTDIYSHTTEKRSRKSEKSSDSKSESSGGFSGTSGKF